MRVTRGLFPTLREAPSDASSASHVWLSRGGYVRRVGAGIYSFLPLGFRVLQRVEAIVREEMNRAGAQEVLLPALLPSDYFKESGRWEVFGDILFRLQDRKRTDYHLGPTHEEIIVDMVRRDVKSYRDLPLNLYQIQTKFRDEPRPRGGILRGREFTMKDAYSFDVDEPAALQSYEAMRACYCRIFDRMGFEYRMVSADSGAMGGSSSAEFQILVQSGEDVLAACRACDYAANIEVAETKAPEGATSPGDVPAPARVHTPNAGSIEVVSKLLKLERQHFLKSLVYDAEGELVLAVVRGDHEINAIKLARALGVAEVSLADAAAVTKATGAALGFAGPVGFTGRIIIDPHAAAVHDGVSGANETDYHLIHVEPGRDFQATIASIREVVDGDACPSCGAELTLYRGIEAGHIFVLGTRYTEQMGASYLDDQGKSRPLVMGCYGIGISRLVAAIVEQNHDKNGIIWPAAVAPYDVHIVQIGQSEEVVSEVARLERELEAQGINVLVDDRDERPGSKFKDADLIGVPHRLTVGDKALGSSSIEYKARSSADPKSAELLPVANSVEEIARRVRTAVA